MGFVDPRMGPQAARLPRIWGFTYVCHRVGSGMPLALDIDREALADICRRYHVTRLELFGSRARGAARPDSDTDLLVTFAQGRMPSLLAADGFMALMDELERVMGGPVDLLTRASIESDPNEYFRSSALDRTETLYAA